MEFEEESGTFLKNTMKYLDFIELQMGGSSYSEYVTGQEMEIL